MGLDVANSGSEHEAAGAALDDAAVRWQKVKELFGDALEQDPAERKAFLDQACNGDEALRAEVESLLAAAQGVTDQAEPEPKPDRMLGRRLGAYQILESIASGGMATVYLAHRADDEYRKRVAIKLIHPGLASDAWCRRFRSERQTLAALDHPDIVKLLDGGTTEEGLPYLVMDYVDGHPIDEYCDQHQLTVEERLKLFRTVCGAVEHAHQNRIIHRDLKPSNILVTADGSARLLDFGIAKLLNPELSREMGLMTTAGIHHMTPAYASPEQVRGDEITYASDVYSLGVVLYELLTGHRPYRFNNYTASELVRVICETEVERPSTIVTRAEPDQGAEGSSGHIVTPDTVGRARGLPLERLQRRLKGDLDNIVLKALHKEPQRRYGSVQEFSEDIARQLEDRPVRARANTLQYRARKLIRRRKVEMVGLVLLLVLAGGWGFSLWRQGWLRVPSIPQARANEKAGVPAIHSLAVLPLKNLSGDPGQEYFADGMTEELITELSRTSGLMVISRTSVMRYKKTNKSLPEIARELNVDAIVEGSVLRSGDRVRITAQLIYAPKDTSLWAEAYDRDVRDVLTLQANVASDVAQQIHGQVTPHERAGRSRPHPVNLAALDAYLKGEYHIQRFGSGGDPEERYRAAEYFRQATQIDPGFARAWVELASAYITNVGPSPKEAPIVEDALEKALAADPGLSDAHSWMARFKEYHDWDFAAAEQEFRRAIELDPNSALAHEFYGDYLNNMGRWPEAEREEQLAQALDPNNDHLSDGLYNRGEYNRALEISRNDVELHPEDGADHWRLSNVYFALGKYPEGIAEVQATFRQYGYPEAANALAKTYAANGYKGALRLYAKELATVQGNPACPTMVANVYRILGDKDEAFKWLERGFVERDGFLVGLNLAEFQSLRGDPRFDDLVRRVGLPEVNVAALNTH